MREEKKKAVAPVVGADKVEASAKDPDVHDICDICGRARPPKNGRHRGLYLCSSCENIAGAMNRRPEAVRALARHMGLALVAETEQAAPSPAVRDEIEAELKQVLAENVALANVNEGLRFQLDDLRAELTAAQVVAKWSPSSSDGAIIPDGYESLLSVLADAVEQAANGKGKARHAVEGQAFGEQLICVITRELGPGFPLGQARKKIVESTRLPWPQARAELLGAINYLAARIIVGDEQVDQGQPAAVSSLPTPVELLSVDEAA